MEYAILGGGALGLTVALRLLEAGECAVVYEREPEAGGLAAGFRVGDAWLEKFYHHLFRTDTAMQRLIAELDLADRLLWPRPRTVTLWKGKVYQLDSPLTVMRFPPLSPVARVRMAAVLAFLKLAPAGPLEGRRAAPWLRRWMGAAPYRVIWEPLLRGKFGACKEEVALPWFWARVHDRTTELGYLRGGFQPVYERLVERIVALGGEVHLGTAVAGVATVPDGKLTVTTDDGARTFDRVVSTLPPRLTCRLVPELPDDYRARYDWGRAYGAHCLILALDRPLTDAYWMNINDPGYPFLALVEHTNYMPKADYGGRHLVYLGNYRPMDDPLFAMSEDEVLAEFLPHLARINPAFTPDWVTESWLFAAPFAQPIVTTDYRDHIPPFETPIPGLYEASMFQVYPHDRGQNYSVLLAEELVGRLTAEARNEK
ncbi:MAG TPA: NAD(P)/FAD-dependent oxidoreductase [Thermomicrobiales bacterium]|nr:NAD(P)/FAD-dependent oxidoreductase [Thermomicrobiales bacterium]